MNNKNIDRLEEKQAKCLAKWNSLNVPLHEGETVVQMVNTIRFTFYHPKDGCFPSLVKNGVN